MTKMSPEYQREWRAAHPDKYKQYRQNHKLATEYENEPTFINVQKKCPNKKCNKRINIISTSKISVCEYCGTQIKIWKKLSESNKNKYGIQLEVVQCQ